LPERQPPVDALALLRAYFGWIESLKDINRIADAIDVAADMPKQ
jgi:hypothetical protein